MTPEEALSHLQQNPHFRQLQNRLLELAPHDAFAYLSGIVGCFASVATAEQWRDAMAAGENGILAARAMMQQRSHGPS